MAASSCAKAVVSVQAHAWLEDLRGKVVWLGVIWLYVSGALLAGGEFRLPAGQAHIGLALLAFALAGAIRRRRSASGLPAG